MNHLTHSFFNKALVSILLIAAVGCGAKDGPKTSAPVAEGSGITAEGEQQAIRLGQIVTQLELNHTEKEDIIEVRDVQTTCTRTVQRGTRNECHTEYEQQCSTRMEQECRNVPVPVCTNQPQQVCRNVPDQVCHTEQVPVCQNVPRQVCSTVQKCETVNDRVCRGVPPNQTCTNIPRRVCSNVQSCHTENSQVCHTETRQKCESITRRECHTENQQVCHNENRQECRNVPRQHCEQVPRQACIQVPIMVQEQYACMQPQRVKVGERVVLHQLAQVRINLVNPRNLDVTRDEILVTLINGQITAVARSASGIQYQIRETSRFTRRINDIEELITVSLEVTALF